MFKVVNGFKNMFLDLFSMGKGFLYGFVMIALFIIIGTALLYGLLALKNILL
ncbi:hypothetical protein PQ478_11360 [Alkalihalophilus pseudofirmus]|uniref:hypothetical protein n=1 Tax=Alkalihalophilus pseudofirmus TaxID=79885 RepID=UPI00259B71C1|nr:hypothetical protein [Alkalihalophilus pseudofirmus]WEG15137.1 hypothetical protein PQ478_11360 [Alkalihalophilus pseudofirmus]